MSKEKLTLKDLSVLVPVEPVEPQSVKAVEPVELIESIEPNQDDKEESKLSFCLAELPTSLHGFEIRYLTKSEAEQEALGNKWSWFAWRNCTLIYSIGNSDWKMLSTSDKAEVIEAVEKEAAFIEEYQKNRKLGDSEELYRKRKGMPTGGVGWSRDDDTWDWG
jgi:hypothetical protein